MSRLFQTFDTFGERLMYPGVPNREPTHLYGKRRKAWCNNCQDRTEQGFSSVNWKWTCRRCGTKGLL